MEATTSTTETAIKTASATFALIAGVVSVSSAFAYIIAYRYLSGYFTALGCHWALYLYTPTQIIQTASPVAVYLAGLAFAIWQAYPNMTKGEPKIKSIFVILVAAAVFYGIHLLIERYATSYKSYFVWIAFGLAAMGGFGAFTRFVSHVLRTHGVMPGAVLFIIATGFALFYFSTDRGLTHGRETLSHEDGRSKPVRIKGLGTNFWLARIVPYERALVFSELQDGRRTFRVVAISELTIESTK